MIMMIIMMPQKKVMVMIRKMIMVPVMTLVSEEMLLVKVEHHDAQK